MYANMLVYMPMVKYINTQIYVSGATFLLRNKNRELMAKMDSMYREIICLMNFTDRTEKHIFHISVTGS